MRVPIELDDVLEPGERTPLHTHKHDYVWYVLEGTTLEVFDRDDKSLYCSKRRRADIPCCAWKATSW